MWSRHYLEWKESGDEGSLSRRDPPGIWDYHSGHLPEFCKSKKVWGLEIDFIYAPLNISNNHWVAMMIDIPERHITIWDSITRITPEEVIERAVRPIREIFPYAMHLMADINDRWMYSMEPYTYYRVRSDAVPQNNQTGDCGVYCLKYIEFHSCGMGFPSILCDSNVKTIREKMAYEILYHIGATGQETRPEDKMFDMYIPPRSN